MADSDSDADFFVPGDDDALGSEIAPAGPSHVPGSRIPRGAATVAPLPVLTCMQGDVDGFLEIFVRGGTGNDIRVGAPYHMHAVTADAVQWAVDAPDKNGPDYYLVPVQIWHGAPPCPTGGHLVDVGAIPDVCRANMELLERWLPASLLWRDSIFYYYRTCLVRTDHSMQQLQDAVARAEGWATGREAEVSLADYGDLDHDETIAALLRYAADEPSIPRIDWPTVHDLIPGV